MVSNDWRLEMENMLAAFNRQAIHSLSIIKRSGLLFTPKFKNYFMQASTIRINEAFDQFQVNAVFEDQLDSDEIVSKKLTRKGTNGVGCEANDRNGTSIADGIDWITNASDFVVRIDDFFDDGSVVGAVETKGTDDTNGSPLEIDSDTISTQSTSDTYDFNDKLITGADLHNTDVQSIAHQSKMNESHSTDSEISRDSNFDVEMGESNDSIEMVESQNNSTDAYDDEPTTVKVILDRLNDVTIPDCAGDKSKTTPLNHDRDRLTNKGRKSAPKRSIPSNKKECTICGYVGLHMGNLNRHMRTHTGEKLYGCDRCGKRFTTDVNLMKHAATHIKEFPFHCGACFLGFSSKAEETAHGKHCKKYHYECYLCKKYVTFDKAELTRHMRTHTGAKPFRCEICCVGFVQKQNLKRHLNSIHG